MMGSVLMVFYMGGRVKRLSLSLSHRWWQLPYFWAGIKMYDLISGTKLLKRSYFVTKSKALEEFPMLKADKLVGGIVYYDGEQLPPNHASHCMWAGH